MLHLHDLPAGRHLLRLHRGKGEKPDARGLSLNPHRRRRIPAEAVGDLTLQAGEHCGGDLLTVREIWEILPVTLQHGVNERSELHRVHLPLLGIAACEFQKLGQVETERALQVVREVGDIDLAERLDGGGELPLPVVLTDRGSRRLARLAEEGAHAPGKITLRASHQQRRRDSRTPVRSELRKAAVKFPRVPGSHQTPEQVGVARASGGVVRHAELGALLVGKEGMSIRGGGKASLHAPRNHQTPSLAPGSLQPSRELQVAGP